MPRRNEPSRIESIHMDTASTKTFRTRKQQCTACHQPKQWPDDYTEPGCTVNRSRRQRCLDCRRADIRPIDVRNAAAIEQDRANREAEKAKREAELKRIDDALSRNRTQACR